ncbi:MAG TPA: serine hydrolase domain-containing protein [Sphingomonas sp.]|nr:serine hydrolase domain-containing protein [Sphingomonas sp.]
MIDRRLFLMGGAAATALAPRVVRAATGAKVRAATGAKVRAVDAIAVPSGFNGVIAYARGGRIEHCRAIGYADVEAGVPMTADTRIRWGSASKWLTSVAALRLAEQGKLRIDAPIGTYLPNFRSDTGRQVRVDHLLSNTSGIPDLLTRQIATEPALRTSTAQPADIVARFANGDLAFAPGAGWDYAALNWAIVADILERVSGTAFPDLLHRLVFDPLRMRGAGLVQAGRPAIPQLAAAYATVAPPVRKMVTVPPFLAASGNVAGTVRDAVNAAHGIVHGPLLTPASRRDLMRVRWPAQDYALGGRVQAIGGELWAWETGKVQAYRTHIAHRLSRSETIVVFNTTDMEQSAIAAWVESIAIA